MQANALTVEIFMAVVAFCSMATTIVALFRTSNRARTKDARDEGERQGNLATIIAEYAEKFERAFRLITSIDEKRQEHEKICARDKAIFAQSLADVSASQERMLNRLDSTTQVVNTLARRRANLRTAQQLGTK